MATQQHPPVREEHPDRSSCTPFEASAKPQRFSGVAGSWLLGGALALLLGGTSLHMAWHGDQGGDRSVLGSNTEPSAIQPRPQANQKPPVAQLSNEQDEDEPLPSALPFDDYVAKKALELKARGVKCGYRGKMELRVSFAPSGNSTRAEVTSTGVNTKTTQCVVGRLENTSIPAFRGTEERSVQISLAMR